MALETMSIAAPPPPAPPAVLPDPITAILQAERLFHDAWARQSRSGEIQVDACFEHFTAFENRFILRKIGRLDGMRLLDVGSGLGESAVYFAKRGAMVTATDVSPGMLERCQELAAAHHTAVHTVVCPAEHLDVPAGSYDIIYGANILHHVTDLECTLAGVRRALAPDGRFFFWDPLAYNPAINVYRRMADQVRTADEAPLRMEVLDAFHRHFHDVHHREFWLCTLLLFAKYFLVDRIHPNQDRYWKRIYREPRRTWRWLGPLAALDRLLLSLPLINRLAWNMVVWGGGPRSADVSR